MPLSVDSVNFHTPSEMGKEEEGALRIPVKCAAQAFWKKRLSFPFSNSLCFLNWEQPNKEHVFKRRNISALLLAMSGGSAPLLERGGFAWTGTCPSITKNTAMYTLLSQWHLLHHFFVYAYTAGDGQWFATQQWPNIRKWFNAHLLKGIQIKRIIINHTFHRG